MFLYELVHSLIEIQSSLCLMPTVNNDFSTINIEPVFENLPKKQLVLNKYYKAQK